ncbi:MAG: type II secretion system F family protein [Ruminiclostridium sp.]|nr:type II secretion system F family protein [Ruminiclostridium sp.]
MLELIMFLTFVTLLFITYHLTRFLLVKKNSILRLKSYINVEEMREEKKKSSKREIKSSLNFVSKGIGNVKFLDGYKKKIQVQLTRAHLLLKAEEYITLCLVLFIILFLLVIALKGPLHWPLAILTGIAGWIAPSFILKSKIKKRVKNLNDQLGDAILLISNSLKAGYSFFQAIDTVSKEMAGPISEEFILLQKEINFGLNTDKALENMTSRVMSDDLELVVTAVMIQRQVGGNLAEVLDNISSTIRDRVRVKSEIKTATAQGRMSGLIISLLPIVLGIVVYLINPKLMSLLFTHPLGILILVVSIVMESIGIFLIRKIVQIEF